MKPALAVPLGHCKEKMLVGKKYENINYSEEDLIALLI